MKKRPNRSRRSSRWRLDPEEAKNWAEVFLRMKPEKAERVKFDRIDGQKYLMIPMEEDEHVNLNGVEK